MTHIKVNANNSTALAVLALQKTKLKISEVTFMYTEKKKQKLLSN